MGIGTPASSIARLKFTSAEQAVASAATVVSAGQVIMGATGTTVTVNVQVVSFPAPSAATKVCVVIPIGKVSPLARPAVCWVVTRQLSVPTGAVNVKTEPAAAIAVTVVSVGQVIAGFSLSSTVTVNVQTSVPAEFVAVAVTVVVPGANSVPGA